MLARIDPVSGERAIAPQLFQVRQGRYLVDVDEVLSWAKNRWVETEKQLARRRAAIRLASGSVARTPHHANVRLTSEGNET